MYPCRYLASLMSLFLSISITPLIVHGVTDVNQSKTTEYYHNSSNTCSKIRTNCSTQDGIIIPLWRPQEGLSTGDRISRAIVYLLALIYLFIGVAVISDRFMASIEVITSQKREIRRKNPDGTISVTTVAIWNETVSNLTLMALGSSAPEILLSIIEVVGKNFNSGDLGPGTIVGSAAFNLFVIIAICIVSIPTGEVRRIRHQRVFFVTTAWSIFAYIWLWAIVAKISPGYIEVWEGTLTFLFFPLTVFSAYIVDTKVGQFIRIRITSQKQVLQLDNHTTTPLPILGDDLEQKSMIDGTTKGSAAQSTSDLYRKKTNSIITGPILDQLGGSPGGLDDTLLSDHIESQRRDEFIDIWRQLRKQYPNHDMHTLNDMASLEMMNRVPKSRGTFFKANHNFSIAFFHLSILSYPSNKAFRWWWWKCEKKNIRKIK
jgi:solute carrier family 8 (sodium/calcium exchanger)